MNLNDARWKWVKWQCCFWLSIYVVVAMLFWSSCKFLTLNFAVVAQKEVEDLQRWREANRATSVHLTPERLGKPTHRTSVLTHSPQMQIIFSYLYNIILTLCWCTCLLADIVCWIYQGGNATLAEARQKQFTDLRCSKLQKKVFDHTFTVATLHSPVHFICTFKYILNSQWRYQSLWCGRWDVSVLPCAFPLCDGWTTKKYFMWPVVSSWERRSWTRGGDKKRRRSCRRWKQKGGRWWDQQHSTCTLAF